MVRLSRMSIWLDGKRRMCHKSYTSRDEGTARGMADGQETEEQLWRGRELSMAAGIWWVHAMAMGDGPLWVWGSPHQAAIR